MNKYLLNYYHTFELLHDTLTQFRREGYRHTNITITTPAAPRITLAIPAYGSLAHSLAANSWTVWYTARDLVRVVLKLHSKPFLHQYHWLIAPRHVVRLDQQLCQSMSKFSATFLSMTQRFDSADSAGWLLKPTWPHDFDKQVHSQV
jgi:hypothetical protein